jgi:hypothetical protein
MLGAFAATNVGHLAPLGVEGWRWAFWGVAGLSAAAGAANLVFSVDPRVRVEDEEYRQQPDVFKAHATLPRMLAEIGAVLAVPSFAIVVLQGFVGSTPWNALVFNTLYLQLLGFSDWHASLVAALFLGGTAVGGLVGGAAGDWAAARSPNHGRILVAQASVGVGVPFGFAIFRLLPASAAAPLALPIYCVAFFSWGLLISWAGPACTQPVFGEIVPAQARSIVYSFDRAFEGAVAATGAPLVGWIAETLGYGRGTDAQKAAALSEAMLLTTTIPWALCCLFFSGLHVTYWRDRARAQVGTRARSGFASARFEPSADMEDALAGIGMRRSASAARLDVLGGGGAGRPNLRRLSSHL